MQFLPRSTAKGGNSNVYIRFSSKCSLFAFFAYLPYGICSKYATNISHLHNPYASMLLLGPNPDATVKAAEAYRKNTLDRSRYMIDKGLITEQYRPCGSPAQDRIFRTLTKEGLAILTEPPNISAFTGGQLTPFFTGNNQAESVRITTSGLSPNQLYGIWCHSHVQAMFRVNGHLTWLDRKPYGSGIVLGPIHDEESCQQYVRQHGYTLLAYTYRTLTDLYANNYGLYMITQAHSDDSWQTYENWLHTPALYLRNELPDVLPDNGAGPSLHGSKQTMRRTDLGLATGKRVNYACFHSNSNTFRWISKREKAAKIELDKTVQLMKPHTRNWCEASFAVILLPVLLVLRYLMIPASVHFSGTFGTNTNGWTVTPTN